jgi:prevent-host-death family protein
MTHRIGVQDLKKRASEIVREVHEREAEFVVTLRGE